MSDLKPCPFCGNEPDSRTSDTDGNKYYTCGSRWCRNGNWYTLEEWNKRPLETDGWIAVSERLPETYETVLVALGKGVTEARYSKPHKFVGMCHGWHAVDGYCFGNKVTHWRPLPQPPEVKNE